MRLTGILAGIGWKKAIAEVGLIVVGVTLALWADAWLAHRGDQQKERARLVALSDNAEETLEEVRGARAEASEAADVLRRIVQLEPPDRAGEDVLGLLRHGLLYGSSLHAEMSVYDDLKNSGELALLTNPELRRALSQLDTRLERLRLAQADLTTVQQIDVDTYMVDHIDLRAVYGKVTGLPKPADRRDPDLGFVSDAEFQNRMLLKLDLITQLERELQNVEIRLLEVQRHLASELN